MLVFISDLHFTDGTTSNWQGGKDLFNIDPRAFKLFICRIVDIVKRHENIKKVHFIFNGDIFDPLRSYAWFDIDESEQPWSIPLKSDDVGAHMRKILADIIQNPNNSVSLQWLSGTHEEFNEIWNLDVAIKRTYIPGNHDRTANIYPECREMIYRYLLNMPGKKQPFKNKFLDQEHQTLAMHGHEADAFNCEYDRKGSPVYKDVPIGDAMTTVLFANVGRRAQTLSIPRAAKMRFKDIDNVRPSLAAVRYVQDIIKDFGIERKVDKMIKGIVNEFEDLKFYDEWTDKHDRFNIGYDEADKLQTALRAIKLLGSSVPAGMLEKLAGFFKDTSYQQFAYKRLTSIVGADLRYCILGHTHEPLHVPVTLDSERGLEKHYLNTGTFRTTFMQTYDEEDFLRLQRMSFVIIYGPKEYSIDQNVPVYEMWSGLRMRN